MYAVVIQLAAPATLDASQGESAAAILGRFLGLAREATDADGARVTVVDRWVGTHPGGANIAVVVHADRPQHALDAVTAYLTHGLQTISALDGWTITEAGVHQPGSTRPASALTRPHQRGG